DVLRPRGCHRSAHRHALYVASSVYVRALWASQRGVAHLIRTSSPGSIGAGCEGRLLAPSEQSLPAKLSFQAIAGPLRTLLYS
ncbi:hypothetical protein K466DRAFT_592964, partial [Polyporus arcularius HHB13444]